MSASTSPTTSSSPSTCCTTRSCSSPAAPASTGASPITSALSTCPARKSSRKPSQSSPTSSPTTGSKRTWRPGGEVCLPGRRECLWPQRPCARGGLGRRRRRGSPCCGTFRRCLPTPAVCRHKERSMKRGPLVTRSTSGPRASCLDGAFGSGGSMLVCRHAPLCAAMRRAPG